MPPTPFLQHVGKLVATIMGNLVSEDHFDEFGVILSAWRVQNGAEGVRELPKRFPGGSKRPPGGSAGSPEGSQGTFGVALGVFWWHLGGQWGSTGVLGGAFWVLMGGTGAPQERLGLLFCVPGRTQK